MNPVVIILGIIVILVIYLIYTAYFANQTIAEKVDLNKTPRSVITADSLINKASPSYSYGMWFFFNYNPIGDNVDLLKYANGTSILKSSTGKLTTSFGAAASSSNTILNTVPVQRWTHVLISVDRRLLDIYIDGKLYKSSIMPTAPQIAPGDLLVGPGTTRDAYLSKVKRWGTAVNPTTAWNTYLEGTGVVNSPVNYNIEMSMSENSKVTSTYSLF